MVCECIVCVCCVRDTGKEKGVDWKWVWVKKKNVKGGEGGVCMGVRMHC